MMQRTIRHVLPWRLPDADAGAAATSATPVEEVCTAMLDEFSPSRDRRALDSRATETQSLPGACLPGNDLAVSYGQLAVRDQRLLCSLFRRLAELLQVVGDPTTDAAHKWRKLAHWTDSRVVDALIDEVTELGEASGSGPISAPVAAAMHEVRGGALTALLGRFQLAQYLPQNENGLRIISTLVRDHLEIMRKAISGLEERARGDWRLGPWDQTPEAD